MLEDRLGFAADGVLRLAALGVGTIADAEALDARMRLSARDRKRLDESVAHRAMVGRGMAERQAKLLVYQLGPVAYRDAVLLAWADGDAPVTDAGFEALARLPERWRAPQFPITGADVVSLGVLPGPIVGVHLAALESDWTAGGFAEDRLQLLARLSLRVSESGQK